MIIRGYQKTGRCWVNYVCETLLDGAPAPDGLLITCIREHHECMPSSGTHRYDRYMRVLRDHHEHEGPKLLVYYEDMIGRTKALTRTINALAEALGVPGAAPEFLAKLDAHRTCSMTTYMLQGGTPKTNGQDKDFFKTKKKKTIRRIADKLCKRADPEMYSLYINKRYETCC